MKSNIKARLSAFTGIAVASLAFLALSPAEARKPFTQDELAAQSKELLETVKQGDDLWHDGKLGKNGLACGNCHPDGAASNPHTFPKFQANLGQVIPLRDMINWCIQVPLEGKALDVSSKEMKALEAYSFYMYRGFKLTPGEATQQHPSVKVKSGAGYP
jgi:thiosulfate dehydrogenase